MRRFLQKLLRNRVRRLADRYSSRPVKRRVHASLTRLFHRIVKDPGKKGPILHFGLNDRFIILSDQHKGAKNGADDFMLAERNYLAALDHYFNGNYCYINLGDSEELWKNGVISVTRENPLSFEKEKQFLKEKRFIKIFGNHDLFWDNDPLAAITLLGIYGEKVRIYTGALLETDIGGNPFKIFLTHGHQGDLQSDGNWFSKWFVSMVWAPLQSYLGINPNTPSNNDELKTEHNRLMYEWSARQENMLLVTGHTHQPVFLSLTHLERLYQSLNDAKKAGDQLLIQEFEREIRSRWRKGDIIPDFTSYRPTYFNAGCCCFDDGDITGIEIADGYIRLVKWEYDEQGLPARIVLEEISLSVLAGLIGNK
ncbi:metallophosphoesterase [Pedobacter sp. HMF7056]|uniref:Metallophosphoesterase n=1 Tax=Hufsiella ginkgonis TaxID=2695274 RepID=A0A7K1XZI9_9SPHI|nr:metallophosphoesterase [Hufsiella ginkgonis]